MEVEIKAEELKECFEELLGPRVLERIGPIPLP